MGSRTCKRDMHRALWGYTPTDTHGIAFCVCTSRNVGPTPTSSLSPTKNMPIQDKAIITDYCNTLHANYLVGRKLIPGQIDFDPSLMELQPGETSQGTKYAVLDRTSDQGPPEVDHGVGGSVTVQRFITDLPALTEQTRDILYVKCSPPSTGDETRSQWASAMQVAVSRLEQKYATRALCFILGVGMEWLPFYWDPNSPAPTDQALRMAAGGADGQGVGEAASTWYSVSAKVRPPPGIDAGHVDAEGVIRTGRARSLDCFTVAPSGAVDEAPGLAFQEDLDFLEEFIGVVERHDYVGENEPDSDW